MVRQNNRVHFCGHTLNRYHLPHTKTELWYITFSYLRCSPKCWFSSSIILKHSRYAIQQYLQMFTALIYREIIRSWERAAFLATCNPHKFEKEPTSVSWTTISLVRGVYTSCTSGTMSIDGCTEIEQIKLLAYLAEAINSIVIKTTYLAQWLSKPIK